LLFELAENAGLWCDNKMFRFLAYAFYFFFHRTLAVVRLRA
jgi:hypothetical protein